MFENITPSPENKPIPESAGDLPVPGADGEGNAREDGGLYEMEIDPLEQDEEVEMEGEKPGEEDEADRLNMALEDWKKVLRRDFERWLSEIDEIPDEDGQREERGSEPDLYSFYEQLAASTVETRKNNRRTAEAFSQWSEILAKFDADLRLVREQLARQAAAPGETLPRPWCLALIEIVDRLHRMAAAFAVSPGKAWWGGGGKWQEAWETQRQGFEILLSHVEALLKNAGITRLTNLHQPFDPATMAAVAVEPSLDWPNGTVLEEVAAGYQLRGELLRVAQVKVSTRPTA